MKSLITLLALVPALVLAYDLDSKALHNEDIPFLGHHADKPFGSYLTLEVHYAPVKKLLSQLESDVGLLKNRGEAHITVITPVEFDRVLKPAGVTIQEINEIALEAKIQASKFTPVCVGAGSATIDGKLEKTYFMVVKSPELLAIRKKVADLYDSKDADPARFDPDHFYPHITLGYTWDDLHEQPHDVFKGIRACLQNGQIDIR